MMTELEESIHESLFNRFGFIRPSNGWYGIKCPFCGDSKTNRSVHLYIRLAGDNNIRMRCYRIGCDVSRRMSVADAIKLGISNKDVLRVLASNKKFEESDRIISGIKNNIKLPTSIKDSVNEYFKLRTNYDLNIGRLDKFSIIGDVSEFINLNEKNIPDRVVKRISSLVKVNDNDVIGFLNRDRTLAYFRTVKEGTGTKHDKINISRDSDIIHSPYEIRNNMDKVDKHLYIFYSEGTFDAVNCAIHIIPDNNSYISLASFGFSHLFATIRMYSKHYNKVTTIINRDSDINPETVIRYLKANKYRFGGECYFIYDKVLHDLGDYSKGLSPVKEQIIL